MTIENIIIVDEKPSKGGRERDFFLSGHPSKVLTATYAT